MAWFEHGTSRIYYEEAGSGDPVLLLPGWAGSINEFTTLRETLVSAGYRVIAADLPGSGRSEPQPRPYTATYYEDDARSFAAFLEYLGAGPTHLLGFSDGGDYALLMGALEPPAARSIVTWGAAGSLGQNFEMADAMATIVDDPIPPLAEFSAYLKSAYGEANARVMCQSFAKTMRAMMEAGGDLSRLRAAAIASPALLITGEHDFLAPPPLVADMAGAMPNSNAGAGARRPSSVHM